MIAVFLTQVFEKSVAVTIYLLLCIFYSLVANKKVAILANEINGSILSFVYTVVMHYKEKIAIFISNFVINLFPYEERVKISFYIIKEELVEGIDDIFGKTLIMTAISVISIVLLHLKEYWEEKYINPMFEKIDNNDLEK